MYLPSGKLDKLGIEARIIEYKADANIWCMQNRMFLEWDLKRAWMRLEKENLLLADTDLDCISIIQKSYPYDFRDGCDLVYLEKGNQPEEYKDVDLKGKIIFVREPFKDFVNWAIKDKGALGIVTDYMRLVPGIRTRENLYDSLNYTSFWWEHTEDEPKCFGYVLSPRVGDTLASLCLKQKEAYEKKEEGIPGGGCGAGSRPGNGSYAGTGRPAKGKRLDECRACQRRQDRMGYHRGEPVHFF